MINEIYIKKFRQLEEVKENKLGKVNELYGSNGSGKTSFISFISWIIYGETLDYGKNDDKNIDEFKPFELIQGEITLDNGCSFSRVYGYESEEATKKNDFYVNGRKCKNQKEYYECINEAFNIKLNGKFKDLNILRALSDPYLLPNNEIQFRELINSLLNIDTYSILFDDDSKYLKIKNDYDRQGKDYDKCKSFYKQQLKEIDNNLENTNFKINELKNVKFDKESYDKLVEEINELKKGYVFVEEDKEYEIKNKEMVDTYALLMENRRKDLEHKLVSKDEEEYITLKKEKEQALAEYNQKKLTNENNNQLRSIIHQKINALETTLAEIKISVFKEVKCPKCETLVNEKEYKEFNKNKVEKTKEIKEKISISKKELESYIDFDLTDIINKIKGYNPIISELEEKVKSQNVLYVSEETRELQNKYIELNKEVTAYRVDLEDKKKKHLEEFNAQTKDLEDKLSEINVEYGKLKELEIHKTNKKTLIDNKSTYELRLSLLNKFKLDEIKIIKNNTSVIFGNEFEFEMLVKNISNDNYKKVCYASVDGLSNEKSNTAKFLKISTVMLEKIKEFIGGCDLPIIFDIADNIGKKTRGEIFSKVKTQIFYTRIDDNENVERELRIINE